MYMDMCIINEAVTKEAILDSEQCSTATKL